MKTTCLAALLLVALPGAALAEEVAFTTLARGEFGPPGSLQELVFVEEHQLVTTLLAQQLDPDPEEQIDWSTHQVIAVLMGTCASGGHSTTIDALELSPSGDLTVRYTESRPDGAAASFQSAPFHMILCRRNGGAVRFERSSVTRTEETVTGRVELDGEEVRIVTAANALVVQPASRARELARFPGREVRVVGHVRGEWGTPVLEISRVLSPERQTITGTAQVEGGRPVLRIDGLATPVRVSGPAQSVVHAAAGATVECDAAVFTTIAGAPVEAHVDAVTGAALRDVTLRSATSLLHVAQGGLDAGDEVEVLGTYGLAAHVRNAMGDEGWVHVRSLRLGQAPLAEPSETPGLVGEIGSW